MPDEVIHRSASHADSDVLQPNTDIILDSAPRQDKPSSTCMPNSDFGQSEHMHDAKSEVRKTADMKDEGAASSTLPGSSVGVGSALPTGGRSSLKRSLNALHLFSGHSQLCDELAAGLKKVGFDLQTVSIWGDDAFSRLGDGAGWEELVNGIRTSSPEFVLRSPPSFTFKREGMKGCLLRNRFGREVHGARRLRRKAKDNVGVENLYWRRAADLLPILTELGVPWLLIQPTGDE